MNIAAIKTATEALDFCKSELKECKGKSKASIKRAAALTRRVAQFELVIAELTK